MRRWGFSLHQLPNAHWAAVALGPPEDVVDAHGVRRLSALWRAVVWLLAARSVTQVAACMAGDEPALVQGAKPNPDPSLQ